MHYSTVESLVSDVFGQGDVVAVGLVDLSRRLGVHAVTLRRACRSGRLAGVNIGGRWRVGRDALAAYLAEGLRNRARRNCGLVPLPPEQLDEYLPPPADSWLPPSF